MSDNNSNVLSNQVNSTTPLLGAGEGQNQAPERQDSHQSHQEGEETDSPHRKSKKMSYLSKRFILFSILGLIAVIGVELTFLPRTSLSRDLRRWHKLHLTQYSVKQHYVFLSELERKNELGSSSQFFQTKLDQLKYLSRESNVSLVSNDNAQILSYVQEQFEKYGLRTSLLKYKAPEIKKPEKLSVILYDKLKGETIYEAATKEEPFGTPAYHGYGFHGRASGSYVYAREGLIGDLEKLTRHGIDLKDKIILVNSTSSEKFFLSEKIQNAQNYGIAGIVTFNTLGLLKDSKSKAISRDNAALFTDQSGKMVLPSIPVVPLSCNAIAPILNTLVSPALDSIFRDWDYQPVPQNDNLGVNISSLFGNGDNREITNVVGTLEGVMNDALIYIGTLHDSMVSNDCHAGQAVIYKILSHYKKLIEIGWRPMRTIKFISWDATGSGNLGSREFAKDNNQFDIKDPAVYCYIDIEKLPVKGNFFSVTSHPFFNDILVQAAEVVKFTPKITQKDDEIVPESKKMIAAPLSETSGTLYDYWNNQDGCHIDNILGFLLKNTDALSLQGYVGVPVIDAKFESIVTGSPSNIRNSNYYSCERLSGSNKVDQDYVYYDALSTYLGLVVLSLSEAEPVVLRMKPYANLLSSSFNNLKRRHSAILESWREVDVPISILGNHIIRDGFPRDSVKFSSLTAKFELLLNDFSSVASIYDDYMSQVLVRIFEDFPWYKYWIKLKVYAQFKLSNYKLLNLETKLLLESLDYDYLDKNTIERHVLFGIPKYSDGKMASYYDFRHENSVFPNIHDAIVDKDLVSTIKWLTVCYQKVYEVKHKFT